MSTNCIVCIKKERTAGDGLCDTCRQEKADYVLFEFSRIGTIVDILFAFTTCLVANDIKMTDVNNILNGFETDINEADNINKDAAKKALNHFRIAVMKYKEAINNDKNG